MNLKLGHRDKLRVKDGVILKPLLKLLLTLLITKPNHLFNLQQQTSP